MGRHHNLCDKRTIEYFCFHLFRVNILTVSGNNQAFHPAAYREEPFGVKTPQVAGTFLCFPSPPAIHPPFHHDPDRLNHGLRMFVPGYERNMISHLDFYMDTVVRQRGKLFLQFRMAWQHSMARSYDGERHVV